MNKNFLIIVTAFLFIIFSSAAWAVNSSFDSTHPVSTFEGGKLFKSGKLNVLDLQGNYRQMGRQYGNLLKDQLNHLYRIAIEKYFISEKGLTYESIKNTAISLFNFYPQRFKDIIYGMAETSSLSVEKHIVLNGLELYGVISGCSGIAAWGEYTNAGPLVFGRNYDWFDSYKKFAEYLTVSVFNGDSGISCAIVTFAGIIYATTGINEKGLFLELNNALPSGGMLSYLNRVPAIINLLSFLGDCSTMEQLNAAFNTTRSNFSFIVNVADNKCAYSYEWPPFEIRRRLGEEQGLLVATNHFVNPEWGMALMEDTVFRTLERRRNLLSLGQKNKDKMNAVTMMQLLDIPMNQGGATWPAGENIQTVYQIVAIPGQLHLWLKVPGFQDWTFVDLASLFESENSPE